LKNKDYKTPKKIKYDKNVGNDKMWYYVLVQFISSIIYSQILLTIAKKNSIYIQLFYSFYIISHMFSLSSMIDCLPYANFIESLRLLFSFYLAYNVNVYLNYFIIPFVSFSFIFIWIFNISKN
jgi:hypothetical protein